MKRFKITVNGVAYDVQVEETDASSPVIATVPTPKATSQAPKAVAPVASAPTAGAEVVTAPMPGTILSLKVKSGDNVKKGDALLVLEAMKMENEIMAPRDGVIAGVHVNKGDSVEAGKALISLQ